MYLSYILSFLASCDESDPLNQPISPSAFFKLAEYFNVFEGLGSNTQIGCHWIQPHSQYFYHQYKIFMYLFLTQDSVVIELHINKEIKHYRSLACSWKHQIDICFERFLSLLECLSCTLSITVDLYSYAAPTVYAQIPVCSNQNELAVGHQCKQCSNVTQLGVFAEFR